ncbi:MAG: cytochrome c, partial [Proteobacteria bacterium]|nr:cytochrome c [Pseudomonadota bacterium]
ESPCSMKEILATGGITCSVLGHGRPEGLSGGLSSGPMADVITASTKHMRDDDLRAIATYLKDHGKPARDTAKPLAGNGAAMKAGAAIYKDNCSACHRDDGMGAPGLFPRLAGSANVQSRDVTTLARVVLAGTRAVSTDAAPTAPAMPSFSWRLTDGEVANLLTYIRNGWGNAASAVSASGIAGHRKQLASPN